RKNATEFSRSWRSFFERLSGLVDTFFLNAASLRNSTLTGCLNVRPRDCSTNETRFATRGSHAFGYDGPLLRPNFQYVPPAASATTSTTTRTIGHTRRRRLAGGGVDHASGWPGECAANGFCAAGRSGGGKRSMNGLDAIARVW